MKKIIEKLKTVSKPMQFVIGIFIVLIIIMLAKFGFHFGVWLKSVL